MHDSQAHKQIRIKARLSTFEQQSSELPMASVQVPNTSRHRLLLYYTCMTKPFGLKFKQKFSLLSVTKRYQKDGINYRKARSSSPSPMSSRVKEYGTGRIAHPPKGKEIEMVKSKVQARHAFLSSSVRAARFYLQSISEGRTQTI